MYPSIRKLVKDASIDFFTINETRRNVLRIVSQFVKGKTLSGEEINLTFICTHNSRRSHFGQIAAALAATYYGIDRVFTFSGGTEATRMNENAINSLSKLGFDIHSDENEPNPTFTVSFGIESRVICYSKKYDHPFNPSKDFAAVLTCSDADELCPTIPGAELRVAIPYEDPKKFDGSENQDQAYTDCFKLILTEMLYTFSLVHSDLQ